MIMGASDGADIFAVFDRRVRVVGGATCRQWGVEVGVEVSLVVIVIVFLRDQLADLARTYDLGAVLSPPALQHAQHAL